MTTKPSRLSPCACGSGKRYKDCHGRIAKIAAPPALGDLLNAALTEQTAGRLDIAAKLYREVLASQSDHFDALHMLGVVELQREHPFLALDLISRALDVVGWTEASAIHNLGLALAKCDGAGEAAIGLGRMGRAYRSAMATLVAPQSGRRPLISVVIPSFNHAEFVETAIQSVLAQTWSNWELVIIDDGSADDSVARIRACLPESDNRCRLMVRENRGAPATLNELISLSQGEWIHPLNSDDAFAPDRLQRCVDAVTTHAVEWLFGAVRCLDESGSRLDELRDARAFSFRTMQSAVAFEETLGLAFFAQNPAISTGNLFFSKRLAERIGGFRDLRYHHDWDFCLRALNESEPLFLADALYFYRFHGSNTISEHTNNKQIEVDAMLAEHISKAFDPQRQPRNPWVPAHSRWGDRLATVLLAKGIGKLLPIARLRHLVTSRLQSTPR